MSATSVQLSTIHRQCENNCIARFAAPELSNYYFVTEKIRQLLMQYAFFYLRVVSVVFFVYVVTTAPGFASVSLNGKLELWFEYDGHQANLVDVPVVHCLQQRERVDIGCNLYRSDDGRYWIDRPANGIYVIYAMVTQSGVSYYREYPFQVDTSTTGPLLIALNRILRVQQESADPQSSFNRVDSCDGYARYKVPLLALFPLTEFKLGWQPAPAANRYHYKVWRVRCADNRRLEPVLLGNTPENAMSEKLPPNSDGEYYSLELFARHGSQEIGQLLTDTGSETLRADYPFVVSDPLGSRDWYSYLLLLLVVPLSLWLLLWLLRGTAVLLVRPSKGFAVALLVLLVVGGGYLQREPLMGWMTQFSQKWYRSSAQNVGYSELRSFTGGEWAGYLVAIGHEPFYGNSRRVEIRVSFLNKKARVRLLRDGKWYEVIRDGFTMRKSGTGMTLFGHLREGSDSELWSISIADLYEPALRLALDRMITHREQASGRAVSARRQATGELHHILP